ncbi:hypothetical protein Acsp01_07000 [Actinoplanes sp. NBRC 101535]|nr:hypothetical protein Acsp01_07000 [Actinoplanes sp. NBRC 101535]
MAGSAAAAAAPSPERLKAALLTQAEVPAGFSTLKTPMNTFISDMGLDVASCGRGAAAGGGPITARAVYTRGAGGSEALIETLAAPGAASARQFVAGVASAVKRCPTFTKQVPQMGVNAAVTLTPGTPAKLGDASAGVGFTIRIPTQAPVQGRMVAIADGDVSAIVLMLSPGQPNQRELTAAAGAAARKLASL